MDSVNRVYSVADRSGRPGSIGVQLHLSRKMIALNRPLDSWEIPSQVRGCPS